MIKVPRDRIRRNPCFSERKLALQMGTSRDTIQRAVKQDLRLRAFIKTTCHMLKIKQKKNRVERCKALLRRYAGEIVKRTLFTYEKIFTVEASFNERNDLDYVRSLSGIPQK